MIFEEEKKIRRERELFVRFIYNVIRIILTVCAISTCLLLIAPCHRHDFKDLLILPFQYNGLSRGKERCGWRTRQG